MVLGAFPVGSWILSLAPIAKKHLECVPDGPASSVALFLLVRKAVKRVLLAVSVLRDAIVNA